MLECPFHECAAITTLPLNGNYGHLLLALDETGRLHIHGPVDTQEGKATILRMVVDLARYMGVPLQELVNKERELYADRPPGGVMVQ